MDLIVRAIDVGFGHTKYVKSSVPGSIECAHFPSLAYESASDQATDGMGGKRRTVCIPVSGIYFEVGPEVELAADNFTARQLHDEYTKTPEYRALTAGALHYMKVPHVDLLVVGLPVAQYLAKRTELQKTMTGVFELGKKRQVEVRRTLVVAQPQGAMYCYFSDSAHQHDGRTKNLVIDAGSRTFDWLVAKGQRVMPKLSDSVNRGVSDILNRVARALSAELKEDYRNLEAIDAALRTGQPVRIHQRAHDLKKYDPLVQNIADQAMGQVLARLGPTDDVENVVVVGGGAYLFRRAIKKRFPKIQIREVQEPMYANVRGFQMLGEQYVRENHAEFAGDRGVETSPAVNA